MLLIKVKMKCTAHYIKLHFHPHIPVLSTEFLNYMHVVKKITSRKFREENIFKYESFKQVSSAEGFG